MLFALVVFCVCIAYLLGSVNASIIISKILKKDDIRNYGSGNAGATNTLRVLGKGTAITVVIFDALKGVLAVLIAKFAPLITTIPDPLHIAMYLSALAVVLGHIFPIYFGFKGGKGIMTSIAVIFVLDWEIGVILLVICLAIMLISKYVSLGSCVGAVMFPVLVNMFHRDDILFRVVALCICVLALVKHKDNIRRIVLGTESKLNLHK